MSEAMNASEAILIYAASEPGGAEWSADLLWKTKFSVHDPIIYIEAGGKSILLPSSLEFTRAQKEARVDEVILVDDFLQGKKLAEGLSLFFRARHIKRIIVPFAFPYKLGHELAEQGFEIEVVREGIFKERAKKTEEEVQEIIGAGNAVREVIAMVRDILRAATIEEDGVMDKGTPITSESLRAAIDEGLFERGYYAQGTIVACGSVAATPHAVGHGPIRPYQPIVFDIFPSSRTSHYYTDITRTLFKGDPGPAMRAMYETVHKAQEAAIAAVRPGVDAGILEQGVCDAFERAGYATKIGEGIAEGFIHSLGHGVGIEMHELPHVARVRGTHSPAILEARNVITIEPGLYYPEASEHHPKGGIRIEDILLVEEGGSKLFSPIPKGLDWAIIP